MVRQLGIAWWWRTCGRICVSDAGSVVAAALISGVVPYSATGLNWTEGMGEANLEEVWSGAVLRAEETLAEARVSSAEMASSSLDDLVKGLRSLL